MWRPHSFICRERKKHEANIYTAVNCQKAESNQIKSNFIIFFMLLCVDQIHFTWDFSTVYFLLFELNGHLSAIWKRAKKKQHNKISLKCRHTVLISVNPFHLLRLVVMRFFLIFSPMVLNFFLFICF